MYWRPQRAGPSSVTSEATLVRACSPGRVPGYNFYVGGRQKYVYTVVHDGILPSIAYRVGKRAEKGVVSFPYRGVLVKSRVPWLFVSHETIHALQQLINADLVVENPNTFEVTEEGWLFYVNLMYFLMPNDAKRWLCSEIAARIAAGRECENTELRIGLQKSDIVGAAANNWSNRIRGYRNCCGGDYLLILDVIAKHRVGIVEHGLRNGARSNERSQVLGNSRCAPTGCHLAWEVDCRAGIADSKRCDTDGRNGGCTTEGHGSALSFNGGAVRNRRHSNDCWALGRTFS